MRSMRRLLTLACLSSAILAAQETSELLARMYATRTQHLKAAENDDT